MHKATTMLRLAMQVYSSVGNRKLSGPFEVLTRVLHKTVVFCLLHHVDL